MNNQSEAKPIEILLVEDSPSDALLTLEALKESRVLNQTHHVTDGAEALLFLRQAGQYAHQPQPEIVLLDLNLPKKNGFEVLQEIKTDERLKTIPVIVLTSSKAEVDVLKSYNLHANCYITKPFDFAMFAEFVRSIGKFWFSVVTLPPTDK